MRFIYQSLVLIAVFLSLSGFVDTDRESNGEIAAQAKKKSNTKTSNKKSKEPIVASTDYGSFAMLAEAGNDNVRGSATYGVYFTPSQRFKVSGEYLTQQLEYDFRHGDEDKWVHQYAIGGVYQALLSKSAFQSIDVEAAYVHAFDRKLGASRRIAGSDSAFTSLGTTVSLWECAYLSAALDYDYVKFHRHFQSDRTASGLGGSLNFVQRFAHDFALTLETELRQPFNYYGAMVNWMPQYNSWGVNVGVYFNYTAGKSGVRDIATGGIQLGFSFGGSQKHCNRNTENGCYTRSFCNAGQWVLTPAVRILIVLAIADETTTCLAPTSDPIPDVTLTGGELRIVNLSPFFQNSGSGTFTLTIDQPLLGANTITLDPTTAVLRVEMGMDAQVVNVTVTCTTPCGSTSQTFAVNFL